MARSRFDTMDEEFFIGSQPLGASFQEFDVIHAQSYPGARAPPRRRPDPPRAPLVRPSQVDWEVPPLALPQVPRKRRSTTGSTASFGTPARASEGGGSALAPVGDVDDEGSPTGQADLSPSYYAGAEAEKRRSLGEGQALYDIDIFEEDEEEEDDDDEDDEPLMFDLDGGGRVAEDDDEDDFFPKLGLAEQDDFFGLPRKYSSMSHDMGQDNFSTGQMIQRTMSDGHASSTRRRSPPEAPSFVSSSLSLGASPVLLSALEQVAAEAGIITGRQGRRGTM